MAENFDVVVIGAGPGGYVAAIRASQLGMKVAIIESDHLGGICLNWGCIPTKALLRSAQVYHMAKHADKFGIKCKDVSFDLEAIVKRSRDVASKLSGGIMHLIKKNNITLFDGKAKIITKNKIEIAVGPKNTQHVEAKNIIIATGARARALPGLEFDSKYIYSYKEAMTPKDFPKSLLVVGSGAIGVEFASFYSTLGAKVSIVEIANRILLSEDAEIAALAAKSYKEQGIDIYTGAVVQKCEIKDKKVNITIKKSDGKLQNAKFDKVICAAGVIANTEGIGLENVKIKLDEKGYIITDDCKKTNCDNIYAIGDVTNPPWLAHKASHEGILCVDAIKNSKAHKIKLDDIPGCIYTHPQIASVGITEEQAVKSKKEIRVGRFSFAANGKAIAMGDTAGMVKVIFDKATGELLGAHMIGEEVTEMIQGYVVGKSAELTEAEFINTIFPHPTMSEAMHEAVLDAYDRAIHS